MSETSHKRKRSLQDSTIDMSKVRMTLNRLDALKEELDGIEETEGEVENITRHVATLEEILRGVKKPVCFLTLSTRFHRTDDVAESVILDCQEGRP